MKLADVAFDFSEAFGDLMLIGDGKEVYVYVDGKRTNDLEAIGYLVISTTNWEKFTVKVREKTPSVQFTGKPVPVVFTNVEVKLWQDFRSNEIKVSATADSIEIVNSSRLKLGKGDAS